MTMHIFLLKLSYTKWDLLTCLSNSYKLSSTLVVKYWDSPYLCSLIMKDCHSIPKMLEKHLQGSTVHISPCTILQVLLTAEMDVAENKC